MNDLVIVALIAGGMPILSAVVIRMMDRGDRDEMYRRQDAVAAQAAEAAKLLLESNSTAVESQKATNVKLDVIHTLVNSSYTAAMQGERDSTVRELASLYAQVVLLNKMSVRVPQEVEVAIEVAEKRKAELEIEIADRLKQAKEITEAEKNQ